MVDGETPKEIKKEATAIESAVKDGNITKEESDVTKTAADFLNKEENKNFLSKPENQNKLKSLNEGIEKQKTNIAKGITEYFTIMKKVGNGNLMLPSINEKNITTLDEKQVVAYINVIKRLNNPELNDIKSALEAKQGDISGDKEKVEKQNNDTKLFELLSSDPSKEKAQQLFGDKGEQNRPMWNALFNHIADGKFNITEDQKGNYEKKDVMNDNFTKLIKEYAGLTKDMDGKYEKLTISLSAKDKLTPPNKERISISYTMIKNEKGEDIAEKDKKPIIKDIMFGNTTDVIHQERSDHIKEEDMLKLKDGLKNATKDTIKDKIKDLDAKGAHILSAMISDLLDKGLLQAINTFYVEKSGNDGENKEDQYYSKITDIVTKEAKEDHTIPLKKFLENVNAENLKYLGRDKTAQIANYNKLVDVVNDPNFKKNPVNQDMIGKILALQTQLTNKPTMQEAIKNGVDGFFKAYGKQLIGILERFGGKGCVKKFFHSLGMDAFYAKNLKSIDDNINKIYKEKFNLSKDQKEGITDIISVKGLNNNTDVFDVSKVEENIKSFGDSKEKQTTFGNQLKSKDGKYIKLLDPTLVHYLITKDFGDTKGLKDDGKPLNVNDFVIKDNTTNEWKINENLTKNSDNQDKLIARLFTDQQTRDTIKGANTKIEGVITSKPGKDIEHSRSDLGEKDKEGRKQYSIQSEQDIARFLTAYAFAGSKSLDYVITESDQKNNWKAPVTPETNTDKFKTDDKVQTTGEKIAFRGDDAGKAASTESIIPTKGTELTIVDPKATQQEIAGVKYNFIKVKYGDKTGYIDPDKVEKKTT
ncbi:MAG: hypothetical protein NTX91_05860 [candidate division SR1 bacterium]|nr:hypothetical protein [candidate division SR1 bacterium]